MKKKQSKQKRQHSNAGVYDDFNTDMDDTFAFIAGYTPGGAPYGVTWEETGIDPRLPFEEKVRLYMEQCFDQEEISMEDTDELPFD